MQATRKHANVVNGVSPRGTLAFVRSVQAYALVCGREYVAPEDVKVVAVPVLSHRLAVNASHDVAEAAKRVILDILGTVELPTENWTGR